LVMVNAAKPASGEPPVADPAGASAVRAAAPAWRVAEENSERVPAAFAAAWSASAARAGPAAPGAGAATPLPRPDCPPRLREAKGLPAGRAAPPSRPPGRA